MNNTIAEKLTSLLELQNIDKQLSEIVETRGVLPDEIQALADELTSTQAQLQQDQKAIANFEQNITSQRVRIKDIGQLIQRYQERQMNVRNNREYDALTKEIELQELDSQLLEKKIKEDYEQIAKKKVAVEQASASIKQKEQILTDKQQRLELVVKASQEEEQHLHEQRKGIIKKLDDKDLLQSYEKISKNVSNHLAIAVIKKGACSGCFIVVCPQRQAVVRKKEELIHCEHCGRILADIIDRSTIVEEATEKRPSRND